MWSVHELLNMLTKRSRDSIRHQDRVHAGLRTGIRDPIPALPGSQDRVSDLRWCRPTTSGARRFLGPGLCVVNAYSTPRGGVCYATGPSAYSSDFTDVAHRS